MPFAAGIIICGKEKNILVIWPIKTVRIIPQAEVSFLYTPTSTHTSQIGFYRLFPFHTFNKFKQASELFALHTTKFRKILI
jgi:hypothetical protein